MLAFLCLVAGILTGGLLNWLADFLPPRTSRYAFEGRALPLPDAPSLWRLATSPGYRQDLAGGRPAAWLSLGVELSVAGLFVYLGVRLGLSWQLARVAAVCAFFVLIALIDLKYRLVPDALVYPAAAGTLLWYVLRPGGGIGPALAGGAVGLLPFLLVHLVKRDGVGLGDVKLAALVGLMVGLPLVFRALVLGALAGGAVGLVLLLTRRAGPTSAIPYAPFLCLGALLALLYGLPGVP